MAKVDLTVTVKIKWWLLYLYLPGLRFINWFVVSFMQMDAEPNWDRIGRTVKKGTEVKAYKRGGKL